MAMAPFIRVWKWEAHCLHSFRGQSLSIPPSFASWFTFEYIALAWVQLAHWKM